MTESCLKQYDVHLYKNNRNRLLVCCMNKLCTRNSNVSTLGCVLGSLTFRAATKVAEAVISNEATRSALTVNVRSSDGNYSGQPAEKRAEEQNSWYSELREYSFRNLPETEIVVASTNKELYQLLGL